MIIIPLASWTCSEGLFSKKVVPTYLDTKDLGTLQCSSSQSYDEHVRLRNGIRMRFRRP